MNEIKCLCDSAIAAASHKEVFYESPSAWPTWIVIGALLALFVVLCWKWRPLKRIFTLTRLAVIAVPVFLLGVVVYTLGALQHDSMGFWDAVYTIPSAVVSSLGMFIYQDDISELTDGVKANSRFMAMYSIAHFMAALITSFALVRLIGMRLFYLMDLWGAVHFGEKKNLYLFWGINPQSVTLAESIHKEAEGDKRIVFVNTSESDGDDMEVSIRSLFDVVKLKEEAGDRLFGIKAMMVNSHASLADASSGDAAPTLYGLFHERARLRLLAKLMRRKSDSIHIFFLSGDEDKNINNLEAVMTIVSMPKNEVHVYCHAHHSAKTRWAEIKEICTYGENPRIHIVDSSYLSVFCLKDKLECHPISYVKIDHDTATVSSPFRSMVIGFGETGEEAFKFLYEFGAFIGKDGEKTKFHCTIIDRRASEIEGLFYAKSPAMRERTDTEGEERELLFMQCAIDSRAYWERIESEVRGGLNYIVIAIDNEELAIDTAVNIGTLASRWRDEDETRKLAIYVRSYKDESAARIESIAAEMDGKLSAGVSIKIFGSMREIFRHDVIVADKCLERAKRYNYAYSGSPADQDKESCWEKELKIKEAKADPKIYNIEDTERRRDQNFSNVFHAKTKERLLISAGVDIGKLSDDVLQREKDTPNYISPLLPDDIRRKLINAARLEHERWIAASFLQGWTATERATDEKDLPKKLHNDLRPWDSLRSEGSSRLQVQGYDCDVVDTTIKLYNNDNKKTVTNMQDKKEHPANHPDILPMEELAAGDTERNRCAMLCELYILGRHGVERSEEEWETQAVRQGWLKSGGIALFNIGRLLEQECFSTARTYHNSIGDVREALAEGKDVIAVVDKNELTANAMRLDREYIHDFEYGETPNHAIVILAVDNDSIKYYDPTGNKENTLTIKIFEQAWEDSDRYMVTVCERDFAVYRPHPIDLSDVELPQGIDDLQEAIAENAHEIWAQARQSEGWTYGSERDDQLRHTPDMVPYSDLTDSEREYDRKMAMNTIKLLRKLGYEIVKK